ncbi:MAG: glycoside hydrolase family 3 protein [Clostridiaceae bacterium]|nr:glycoside hydrolase family 3 protein [Clostridiaceae bacterium]
MDKHDRNRLRAQELVAQMTIEERIDQLTYHAPAIPRLNVPSYNWWNEALHGVARAGTATVFPQAIALAAMFDKAFLEEIADAIAAEGRAKFNQASAHGDRDIYKGLTFWSPNVNIFRDPRWGRGHETYGEDPYLSSQLGIAFIRGLQGSGEFLKSAACAKHFAVHSGPESLRHEFDAVVSDKDLWETYLPAFEACVREADVESVMGAYNRTNGEPCCGSHTLLANILRDKWGFKGHVVSDCWAIRDFHEHHRVTKTPVESAALALDAGCDLNCGNMYLHLKSAWMQGLVTDEQVTEAAVRLFTTRYKLGLFDKTDFDDIAYDIVACKAHLDMSVRAAEKSMVLLKNDGILPLNPNALKTVAVIGPNADSRKALIGNYHGTSPRYVTPLEGIEDFLGDAVRVLYSVGSELSFNRSEFLAQPNDRIAEAVYTAEQSDVVILFVGLDETLEGEEGDTGNSDASGDKKSLYLPDVQNHLIEKVTAVGKPVIVCLLAGSSIDLTYADEHCAAVIQAWYPGALGGRAIANVLFGKSAPSGKLPVTFYRQDQDLPDFTDYSMQGRTYRYLSNMPLYPFGYGLTYGRAQIECEGIDRELAVGNALELSLTIKNPGDRSIDEVIQVYSRPINCKDAPPNPVLVAFERVCVEAGQSVHLDLSLESERFSVVDEEGKRYIAEGQWDVFVSFSQPDLRSKQLLGAEPIALRVSVNRA